MLSKSIAFLIQAILPAVMVWSIAHLTNLRLPEWGWLEYLLAIPITGLMLMAAAVLVLGIGTWLYNLALNKHSKTLPPD